MNPQSTTITYDSPIWVRIEDVMQILECGKSTAAEKIREINGSIHHKIVGSRCLTEKFIEYYEGQISRETIIKALSKTPKK